MKKISLIIALASILCGANLKAQELIVLDSSDSIYQDPVSISYGAAAGLTLDILNPSGLDLGFTASPGFNIAAVASFRFLPRQNGTAEYGYVSIQPELQFTSGKVNTKNGGGLAFNYFAVPIMIHVYPTPEFYIEAGPELLCMLSASPDSFATDQYQLAISSLSSKDCGFALGAGYEKNGFSVGLRYVMGISDMAQNLPWKNNMLQVTVGYKISLKKNNDLIILN